ncbi:hypothetical protein PR048_022456 [Dryococelus australis]|uniref:Uncharacterized protein n=1 Tax=Dryococelus australis TaxID=614101 RepID=A0ABQ9H123_9NEOP|nr:hypothetical protein PR048_022456 [Dryococelus australis]
MNSTDTGTLGKSMSENLSDIFRLHSSQYFDRLLNLQRPVNGDNAADMGQCLLSSDHSNEDRGRWVCPAVDFRQLIQPPESRTSGAHLTVNNLYSRHHAEASQHRHGVEQSGACLIDKGDTVTRSKRAIASARKALNCSAEFTSLCLWEFQRSTEMQKRGGGQKIPKKTRRPAASPRIVPAFENPESATVPLDESLEKKQGQTGKATPIADVTLASEDLKDKCRFMCRKKYSSSAATFTAGYENFQEMKRRLNNGLGKHGSQLPRENEAAQECKAGETENPRENPPNNGIVRHDSNMRQSGETRLGIEPGSPWLGGEQANRSATAPVRYEWGGSIIVLDDVSESPGIGLVAEVYWGATVAERLARSPPTKANRVQSPAGSPDVLNCDSCGFFPGISRFPRPFIPGAAPYPLPIARIGSQDLAISEYPKDKGSKQHLEPRIPLAYVTKMTSRARRMLQRVSPINIRSQSDPRPVPRASHNQSENGYAYIKGTATLFRPCVNYLLCCYDLTMLLKAARDKWVEEGGGGVRRKFPEETRGPTESSMHNSHMRKSGSDPAGDRTWNDFVVGERSSSRTTTEDLMNRTRIALVEGGRSSHSTTMAPLFSGFSRFPTLHSRHCSPHAITHRIAKQYST